MKGWAEMSDRANKNMSHWRFAYEVGGDRLCRLVVWSHEEEDVMMWRREREKA